MMDNMAFIIYRMVGWLVPAMLLLMVAILYAGFRKPGGVFVPLLVVGVSAVWAVGMMTLLGIDLHMLTGVMPVVLVALGSADGIHVMRRYYEKRQKGLPLPQSIRETFRELAAPIIVTTVTTMVGFISLSISDFEIIRDFGIVTAIGVFIALLITFLFVPVLLSYAGEKRASASGRDHRTGSASLEWLAERVFRHRVWVTCVLDFKGRRRQVMSPGTWTELFFLDETTALAAGHRPCGYCRRADYIHFKTAWATAGGLDVGTLKAGDIDRVLHRERVSGRGANRIKPTFTTTFGSTPDGVMFHLLEARQTALLKWMGLVWAWSPDGYGKGPQIDQEQPIEVLTPASVVEVIRGGYTPTVHGSVEG
jgi:hypothetical protein